MSVVVARSRHNNAVDRNRRASPDGILGQPEALGKHIRELMTGVAVIHRGGPRGEDPDTGWDARVAGQGGSGMPAMMSGRRAHGESGVAVAGTRGPDAAGLGRPHGGSGAHGGPRWCRGSRRITTSPP
jgi:hypothetical protein